MSHPRTTMPNDGEGRAIPVLGLAPGGAWLIVLGPSSVRLGPFGADTKVLRLYATEAAVIATGDGGVTAGLNDHYLPAMTMVDIALPPGPDGERHTHLAALRGSAATGTLHVSELL